MKPKCVLTGASGLLGSCLLHELKDYEVYALRNSFPSSHQGDGITHVLADLNSSNFESLLPKNVDTIIHLAQSNHFKDFPEKAKDIVNVNTLSTLRLLDYARHAGVKNFIYASTGTVYGTPSKLCLEEHPLTIEPKKGMYYASKLAAEMFVENYAPFMKTIVLRFFFIYGPGQRKHMLIPRLVQSVIDDKPISLQGPEGMKINPIYVADAAKAVKQALTMKESATINIAGSEILTLKQIGETIGQCLGKKPLFDFNSAAVPVDLVADVTKMNRLLMTPKTLFSEGIRAYYNSLENEL